MKRYAVWFISALVALPTYVLFTTLGVNEWLVLGLTFVGALVGAALGTYLMQRLSVGSRQAPGTPPGRDSGKTGS